MPGHPVDGEQGEIRGPLKLFKMPTSSRARGVNTTQMSAGDPTSQTKLAATCTNTPPRPPHIVCTSLKTYILSSDTSGWIAILVRAEPTNLIHTLTARPSTAEPATVKEQRFSSLVKIKLNFLEW